MGRRFLGGASASAALVAAALDMAGTAHATCLSVGGVGNGSGAAAIGTNSTAFLVGRGSDSIAAGSVPPPFVPGRNNTAVTVGNFSSASAIGHNRFAAAFGDHKTKLNATG